MIINGIQIQKDIIHTLKNRIQAHPYILDIIYVGENAVIEKYINAKRKLGEVLGVETRIHRFADTVTLETIKTTIGDISLDSSGIIIQLPLPDTLQKENIMEYIDPSLDIDILTKEAYQQFLLSKNNRLPTVLRACLYIIETHGVSLTDKKICILGAGKLVGGPIADWCRIQGLSFTQMTKDTFDTNTLKEADIIFSGMGVPHLITEDMVKEGVIIFDAGTSEESGSVVGDIHPDVAHKASLFTPVPGGIGPLTVTGLFNNIIEPYES